MKILNVGAYEPRSIIEETLYRFDPSRPAERVLIGQALQGSAYVDYVKDLRTLSVFLPPRDMVENEPRFLICNVHSILLQEKILLHPHATP